MKSTQQSFLARTSVIAVRCALAAIAAVPAAYAGEADDALINPTHSIEVGAVSVDKGSYKFGEYNGLERKGIVPNGGFEVRGGAPYDSDSAQRWSVEATNLGLRTRTMGAEFGEQGRFRLKFGYDEIQRNQYDDYQTPYSGLGTTTLTLPGYPVAAAACAAAPAASSSRCSTTGLANWNSLQSPYATVTPATGATLANAVYAGSGPGVLIPAMMHGGFNIGTLRTRENVEISTVLAPGWSFKFVAKHEDKEGTKLTGVAPGTRQGALVPEPINNATNQFKANLSFVDAKSNIDFGYYGSFFQNSIKSWTMANPFAGTLLDPVFGDAARMVGAAPNQMHRLNLTGGYNFDKTTRLVVSGYYQRMTQDEPFVGPFPATWMVPVTSPQTKVINTNLNATLTMKPLKDLSLLAQYKYEDRDNQTPSHTYTTAWADGAFPANANTFTNEPISRKTQQFLLEGDYKLTPKQSVKLGYQYEQIERTANTSVSQALANKYAAQFAAVGASNESESGWKSDKSKEQTLKLEFRSRLAEALSGRLAYDYSQRRAEGYSDNEGGAPVNPPRSGGALPVGATIPLADNIYFPAADPVLPGFRQFFVTDRNRDRLRGNLNFQASDTLALQANVAYNKEDFNQSTYGLKDTKSSMFGLDATLQANENLAVNAFYSLEDKKFDYSSLAISRVTSTSSTINPLVLPHVSCAAFLSGTIVNATYGNVTTYPTDSYTDPCRAYSMSQQDRVNTFGVGFKAAGLMGGKFDLNGDLSYSRAKSPISVTGGAYFGNGVTAAGVANTVPLTASNMPDITSEVTTIRVSGKYAIDKKSSIRANYQYSRLKSSDWQWDAYNSTPGSSLSCGVTIPAYIGTCMSSPNYTVNSIGLSYIYSFQ